MGEIDMDVDGVLCYCHAGILWSVGVSTYTLVFTEPSALSYLVRHQV